MELRTKIICRWNESRVRRTGHGAGLVTAALVVTALALVGCGAADGGSGSPAPTSGGVGSKVVQVVAAENFWGSIASQLGGTHAHVVSIITSPDTDPHDYEPTAGDARTLAGAQLVVENGIGYDPWAPKLLAAAKTHPVVLNVGDLVGVQAGGNPHRWYNPDDVNQVVDQIVADYQKLDPSDAAYFDEQKTKFTTVAMQQYNDLVASIKATYGGTPVGASESIFSMLAPSLGLDLVTPPSFLKAISEGTDVSAADKETIDDQIRDHQIKVYVYNRQNVTPDVRTQLQEAKAAGIPVATITETLSPAGATYQAWQVRQLLGIQSALHQATAG